MYKIVASDLDETLLDSGHEVPRRNIEAIRAAREMGVHFVPTTGRPNSSVARELAQLGMTDMADEYVIGFNGGAVTENAGSRIVSCTDFDFDLADELFRRGLEHDVCIHVYTLDKVWMWNYHDDERAYVGSRMDTAVTHERTLDFLRGQTIMKLLYMNLDHDYLAGVRRELEPLLGEVDVTYSAGRYLEFNRLGVTKGAALLALADRLGVAREDTIAIGDSTNDLSMILDAGLGCCVANGVDEVKAASGYVCEATNDGGGVAEVIEKFILSQ